MRNITFTAIVLGIVVYGVHVNNSSPPSSTPTVSSPPDYEFTSAVLRLRLLRNALHDPKSFELTGAWYIPDGSLCVEYRAKNAFGAKVLSHAVFHGKGVITDSDRNFASTWNRVCTGKSRNVTHAKYAL